MYYDKDLKISKRNIMPYEFYNKLVDQYSEEILENKKSLEYVHHRYPKVLENINKTKYFYEKNLKRIIKERSKAISNQNVIEERFEYIRSKSHELSILHGETEAYFDHFEKLNEFYQEKKINFSKENYLEFKISLDTLLDHFTNKYNSLRNKIKENNNSKLQIEKENGYGGIQKYITFLERFNNDNSIEKKLFSNIEFLHKRAKFFSSKYSQN